MQLVTPEQIAAVMALVPAPHSFAELDEQVAEGLPKNALKAGVERLGRNVDERRALLRRVVPEATFKRRRDRLSAAESEKTERLARVYATARHVWDSDEEALAFLHTPHAMLDGRPPLEVAMTELGARRVETLLWRLFYGIAA
ncbi:antitoxin Xre/MbcA/ParS toxin-binding domain-containing protein [Thauera butanivorans]|jgi:putative toxin-antitoxin system antitoxin component (TIGR02293 family)|uniref:antitoxin Xre/MbcA/ParS toxin-binding domain-containing protein n=1 Tax=Thauera butanivorans TaxID=86174 RepID=UPI00083999C0|nr:antitoxin Xre/MbcA/ParS toxin-binding domain-containing protein [Thauera butanivorans]